MSKLVLATHACGKGGEDQTSEISICDSKGRWLEVTASSVIAGCKDHKVSLKRVDDKTWEGRLGNGEAIKLVCH